MPCKSSRKGLAGERKKAGSLAKREKKIGSLRLCVDYKQLNKLTVKDKFPIPLVEELLDEISEACFSSKLDIRSSYH